MVLAGDPLLQPVPRLQRWKPEEKCKWETAFTSDPLPVLRAGVLQSAPEVLSCGLTHCSHPAPQAQAPWPSAPSGLASHAGLLPHEFSRRPCVLSGRLEPLSGLQVHRLLDATVRHCH